MKLTNTVAKNFIEELKIKAHKVLTKIQKTLDCYRLNSQTNLVCYLLKFPFFKNSTAGVSAKVTSSSLLQEIEKDIKANKILKI